MENSEREREEERTVKEAVLPLFLSFRAILSRLLITLPLDTNRTQESLKRPRGEQRTYE